MGDRTWVRRRERLRHEGRDRRVGGQVFGRIIRRAFCRPVSPFLPRRRSPAPAGPRC
jgi:hypothetical protein